jgi:hypothetical protein
MNERGITRPTLFPASIIEVGNDMEYVTSENRKLS